MKRANRASRVTDWLIVGFFIGLGLFVVVALNSEWFVHTQVDNSQLLLFAVIASRSEQRFHRHRLARIAPTDSRVAKW
jgi:hypothetical protein